MPKEILLETDKEWKEQYSKSRSESAKRQFITHGNPFEGKTHTDETKAIIGDEKFNSPIWEWKFTIL